MTWMGMLHCPPAPPRQRHVPPAHACPPPSRHTGAAPQPCKPLPVFPVPQRQQVGGFCWATARPGKPALQEAQVRHRVAAGGGDLGCHVPPRPQRCVSGRGSRRRSPRPAPCCSYFGVLLLGFIVGSDWIATLVGGGEGGRGDLLPLHTCCERCAACVPASVATTDSQARCQTPMPCLLSPPPSPSLVRFRSRRCTTCCKGPSACSAWHSQCASHQNAVVHLRCCW